MMVTFEQNDTFRKKLEITPFLANDYCCKQSKIDVRKSLQISTYAFFCFIGTVGDTLRSWRDCYTRGKVFAADSRRSLPNISRLCRKKKPTTTITLLPAATQTRLGVKNRLLISSKPNQRRFLTGFLTPRSSKITVTKEKERRKRKSEEKEWRRREKKQWLHS